MNLIDPTPSEGDILNWKLELLSFPLANFNDWLVNGFGKKYLDMMNPLILIDEERFYEKQRFLSKYRDFSLVVNSEIVEKYLTTNKLDSIFFECFQAYRSLDVIVLDLVIMDSLSVLFRMFDPRFTLLIYSDLMRDNKHGLKLLSNLFNDLIELSYPAFIEDQINKNFRFYSVYTSIIISLVRFLQILEFNTEIGLTFDEQTFELGLNEILKGIILENGFDLNF